jgi:rhodanese-related sulfurtransferase
MSFCKNLVREIVTVLDVRPPDEFALGHLPDAVNIPLRELEARLAEFDPAQEIVRSDAGGN